jgi:hypothetical protein
MRLFKRNLRTNNFCVKIIEKEKIITLLTEDLLTEKSSKSLSNVGTNRHKSKKTHNKKFDRTRKQNL